MRVAYSIGSRLAGGGIGNTAYYAARAIHRAGHLDRLFCLGREPTEIPDRVISSLWFPSRRFLRLPVLYYYWVKDRLYDWRVARRLPRDMDIFHGWNSHCLTCLPRARKRGAVTIVERASAHAAVQARLLDEEYERFGVRAPARLQRLVERSVAEYHAADYVRIPSAFVRHSFLEAGVPASKLIQGPFGVALDRFAPSPEPERFTALFVGHIGLRKGALDLLEAWRRFAGHSQAADAPRLILYGGLEKALRSHIAGYRGQCAFETPGFTRGVRRAYADASVLVLPAIEDGFPLVVLEAMASGRPVIVSENTGSKDAVREGVDGFVVPIRSPDAIAEKLQWLLDHPAERREMGRSAREQAERLPWERYGAELLRAYENALARSDRAAPAEDPA
jgi:glycosyltransferase involved in cell wall biosynthesis